MIKSFKFLQKAQPPSFLFLKESFSLHDDGCSDSYGGGESQYNERYLPGVHSEPEGEAVGAGVAELKGIPQLIIAGSSIDDIVRIVFYQCFLTREKAETSHTVLS